MSYITFGRPGVIMRMYQRESLGKNTYAELSAELPFALRSFMRVYGYEPDTIRLPEAVSDTDLDVARDYNLQIEQMKNVLPATFLLYRREVTK